MRLLFLLPACALAADWGQYLGGSDSPQSSPLKQITKANVARLEQVWSYPVGGSDPYRFNPLVIGNTM